MQICVGAPPPVRRKRVRTFILPFDPVAVRQALLRERERGGQSFIVCPRIADLAAMHKRITELVPELDIVTGHGRMKGDDLDAVMVGFADGQSDVLLTTNIIESGLDIPRANTMLLWRPEQFGLAELHQLRGRVGRGRARGMFYMLTDPETRIPERTMKRLGTLQALEGLGSGFSLSARDAELRGAGDLFGDRQSGHVRRLGAQLYQHLFARAIRQLRGESDEDDWTPQVNLGCGCVIPASYVPEEEVRIELYTRLARIETEAALGDLADEIVDRFGALPGEVHTALDIALIRQRCRHLGIASVEAGPKGIALRLRDTAQQATQLERLCRELGEPVELRGERLFVALPGHPDEDASALTGRVLRALESLLPGH
jgi:transcription-repair coupling factor (superfamily II helicase)